MLRNNQQNYLNSLSSEKLKRIVLVEPWNPQGLELAEQLVEELERHLPQLEVVLMGSVFFKIAGEKDIDITIYCRKSEQARYTKIIEQFFGPSTNEGGHHTGWEFYRDGYHITIFLSDPRSPNTQEQKEFFELLNARPELIKEYEKIKLEMNDKTYKEYQTAKYEFYNRILSAV